MSAAMIVEHGQLGAAHFSRCRRYRYLLTRGEPTAAHLVTFVMLNPSTADADANDRTIARCVGFATRFAAERGWAAHRVAIVNLFAFRATRPRDCFAAARPSGGKLNDRIVRDTCRDAALVVCAWGADRRGRDRAGEVHALLHDAGVRLHRLGAPTRSGAPSHPLYLPGTIALERLG